MLVTDDQVATLRAYLASDRDGYRRLWADLDSRDGYPALLGHAFVVAVQQRFPSPATAFDGVLDYVGSRRRYWPDVRAIPPGVAERLMWYAASGEPCGYIPLGVRSRALSVLLADEDNGAAESRHWKA